MRASDCIILCLMMSIQCNIIFSLDSGDGEDNLKHERYLLWKRIGLGSKKDHMTRIEEETGNVQATDNGYTAEGNEIFPERQKRDSVSKENVTAFPKVEIKSHILWRPREETEEDELNIEPSKLVILPLAAFLAFIVGTCIKISHWWNEDIREADGMLRNVYSAKNPPRRILARVLSTEQDPTNENHTSHRKHKRLLKRYRRRSKIVPENVNRIPAVAAADGSGPRELGVVYIPESADIPMGAVIDMAQSSCSKDVVDNFLGENRMAKESGLSHRQESFVSMGSRTELIPLLTLSSMEEQPPNTSKGSTEDTTNVSYPPLDLPPSKEVIKRYGVNSKQSRYPERKALQQNKKHLRRKRIGMNRPQGVSKLVLDSLSFNLNLMKMAIEEDLAKKMPNASANKTERTSSSSSDQSFSEHHDHYALEHGYIEDCFIHPGECHIVQGATKQDNNESESLSPSTDNTTLSSPVHSIPWSPYCSQPISRRQSANTFLTSAFLESIAKNKPSVSSFSSIGTSSTSLSAASQLGDSRFFYQIANTSPVSSPDCETAPLRKSYTSHVLNGEDKDKDKEYKERDRSQVGQRRFNSFRRRDSLKERPVFFIV